MTKKLDEAIISEVRGIVLASRDATVRSVDFQGMLMYWRIGEKRKQEIGKIGLLENRMEPSPEPSLKQLRRKR